MIKRIRDDAALLRRHHQAAILSRMMVTIIAALHSTYRRKNVGAVFSELMVAFAIRINDDDGKPPLQINTIAKIVKMPRSNVRRALEVLVEVGMAKKQDDGYVGDLEFLKARLNPPYWQEALEAIDTAAKELSKL
jgi:DNA-binding transcriptional ArsR family regulator